MKFNLVAKILEKNVEKETSNTKGDQAAKKCERLKRRTNSQKISIERNFE